MFIGYGLRIPGAPRKPGGASTPATEFLLLEDGTSFLLLEDGADKLGTEA